MLTAAVMLAGSPVIREDWAAFAPGTTFTEGAANGEWYDQFNGYGSAAVVADARFGRALQLVPKASTGSGETHAALVTSLGSLTDFSLQLSVQTLRQLRTPVPLPSETAWVLWRYIDASHFYYFALKPNGWELGKEDPAYPGAQHFLASGPSPVGAIGTWNDLAVEQRSATMTVSVNGKHVVTFTDVQEPYLIGSVGLYCEDAIARFGPIRADAL